MRIESGELLGESHSPVVAAGGLRVLCCVTHYFVGEGLVRGRAQHKSSSQSPEVRRSYVEATVGSCRRFTELPDVAYAEVLVCGRSDAGLVPFDVAFDEPQPELLVFDTLDYMIGRRGEFDYYVLVEDDIVVPPEVLANAIEFDQASMLNEVLMPNRIETRQGYRYNPDLKLRSDWTVQRKSFKGHQLGVNVNPHSAIFVLRCDKFEYCIEHADLGHRGRYEFGGFSGGPMASAFANFLSPVSLYRPYEELDFHHVVHQDPLEPYNPTRYDRFSNFVRLFIPPGLLPALRRMKQVGKPR